MSNLWLPESAGEYLSVSIAPSQSGETEWSGMILTNQAGFDWVEGKLDTGTYFDVLESVGIDPVSFVGTAEDYVNRAVDRLLVEADG